MRTLGNVLWHFPFFGFVTATLYWLFGALLTITIVAAPIRTFQLLRSRIVFSG